MNFKSILASAIIASAFVSCQHSTKNAGEMIQISNPILPGYFADPSVVENNGKYYVYATIDPWGGDSLSCWVTEDFQNWEYHQLNWPTKDACRTANSGNSNVWAPSAIKKGDKYYMYISVGSEVWAGVADSPLGPWKNMLGDKPLLEYDKTGYCHVIDAEVFIDEDGKNYLYWGSGWNWTNGRCYVAELADDMHTFLTEAKEITPTNYFEAPFVNRIDDTYFLTYSDGITIEDSYKVRYATSNSPFGPFVEADNSPILQKDPEKQVYGPGHHTLTTINGEMYILYHKHRLPFIEGTAYRQMCMDKITFSDCGKKINNVVPTDGFMMPKVGETKEKGTIKNIKATASSTRDKYCDASNVLDNSFQTMWAPAEGDKTSNLVLDFAKETEVKEITVIFEYPWEKYQFDCLATVDGTSWANFYQNDGMFSVGSPLKLKVNEKAKQIKFDFKSDVAIWAIYVD